jgi:hypothetical protein
MHQAMLAPDELCLLLLINPNVELSQLLRNYVPVVLFGNG